MPKPKHILVIRFSALGDVAMTIPVLRALKKKYPNLKITILTKPYFEAVFSTLEGVEIFKADFQGEYNGLGGLFSLSQKLKALGIDAVADLHNVLRTKILKVFLLSLPFKQIDKGRSEKKQLVKGKIFKQLKTTVQRYVDVFDSLGFQLDMANPIFSKLVVLNPELELGLKRENTKWIGVAPFAAHKGKMYPLQLMKKVIDEISKSSKVLLFGGGNEEHKILEQIAKDRQNVYNISNKYSLKQELDIISNLDLMVSMDSGNGHLAAMMGVKVITLWGVTHPYAGFAPFNQDKEHQILSDREKFSRIPTSVYGNRLPNGYEEVMTSISPSTVIKKIDQILK